MIFNERIDLADASSRRRTADGYLVAMGRAARTGIQQYRGSEVGRPDLDIVRVYRPQDEVFSTDSLGTYAHKPVTNDHPPVPVTADNWKEYSVGFVGDEVARDGEHVRIPLMLADAKAIEALDSGKAELSAGYACQLDWTSGTTPEGQAYDAIQRDIKINHVALVDQGRAGSARIGDRVAPDAGSNPPQPQKDATMSDKTLKTVTVDGLSIEVTDQGAQVIAKLQAQIADAKRKEDEYEEEKKRDREEMEKKDGEIAALQKQIPTGDALDALVAERTALIGDAKAVLGAQFDAKGKSAEAIRREVVTHKLGDDAKEMSDAAIEGAYRAVMKGVDTAKGKAHTAHDAIRSGDPRIAARQAMLDHLHNAHKEAK
jgi:hypothetical protein